ncbi:hypothetical protein O6H91_04G033000 [Diphasiastrum complanatum]|uniref:Uncharacterized protein n=1 Tax=Diphasiastrum complanatum TaxID=34168 RepID=A0ACC2DVI2_DIPCM|nr:hypothetical protein O6H91_04G033000 [Diphasiastrum complanatum]
MMKAAAIVQSPWSLNQKPSHYPYKSDLVDGGGFNLSTFKGSSIKIQTTIFPLQKQPHKLEVRASIGNTFGNLFRVTTFGESHGGGVGCIIDGCPPRLPLSESDMQVELDRRRPGQSRITTPRKESDTCKILSGVGQGSTLGTPIAVSVPNTDQRGNDYSEMALAYRPSHADATYDFKYGVRAVEGGGRSSARETIGRVAAGAVAKKLLKIQSATEVLAYVSRVHGVELPDDVVDHEKLTIEQIESNIVRCPDPVIAEEMIKAIDMVRLRGDSVGGVITCIARNVPRGLGSPVFDKLEAELAKGLMSLPATKGFEIGSGFSGSKMTGSEHNDEFYIDDSGNVRTRTNRSGGIQTLQKTVTREGHETEFRARGRHDPCVVPRAVPMVEAMVALVLADQLLQHHAQCQLLRFDTNLPPANGEKGSENVTLEEAATRR